jgi:hypothetical protein
MQWEYLSVVRSTTGALLGGHLDRQAFTEQLNDLGERGWELVSVFPTTRGGTTLEVVAVLKRRVASAEPA